MSTSVSWPPIGGTTYSIPATGELNWQALSNFLIAIGTKAQGTDNTKLAIRVATTTPVSVATVSDCVVVTNLAIAGPVAVNLDVGITGQTYFIVDGKGDAATNNVTITPAGGALINGAATYVLNKNRAGIVISFNGTGWTVLAEFTNIAAGTIPRSSIAAGTPNHVVINDGSGNLSSEAQLAKSRGGTGADNSSVTFPASGIIVTEAAAETLTNKSIDANNNTLTNIAITALKTVIGQALSFLSFDAAGVPIATKAVPTGAVLGTTDAQVITLKDIDGGTATNTDRITLPKNTTTNLNALTRKQATLLYDSTTDQVKYDNGSVLTALAATTVATPTAQGTVTSYFATIQSAVSTVTNADATSTTSDGFLSYVFSTGASNRVLTLPAASANIGRRIIITKSDSGVGLVTITRAGSDTINGANTVVMTEQYSTMVLLCVSSTLWINTAPDVAIATRGMVNTGSQTITGAKSFNTITTVAASDNNGNGSLTVSNGSGTKTSSTIGIRNILGGANDMTGAWYQSFSDGDGTTGSISAASATTIAYNTSSDARLKEDVEDFPNSLAILDQIKPRTYRWKKDGHQDYGFIAQELKSIYPYAVSGDETGDVKEAPMGIDYGKLTPILTAALKEALKQIETLKADVALLKERAV